MWYIKRLYLHHDDVIKWKYFPRNWPFVRGIHRSPVNSPHKGQWRGALMFSLIYAWINDWVNNGEAGDLRRHRAHYAVIVMVFCVLPVSPITAHIFIVKSSIGLISYICFTKRLVKQNPKCRGIKLYFVWKLLRNFPICGKMIYIDVWVSLWKHFIGSIQFTNDMIGIYTPHRTPRSCWVINCHYIGPIQVQLWPNCSGSTENGAPKM